MGLTSLQKRDATDGKKVGRGGDFSRGISGFLAATSYLCENGAACPAPSGLFAAREGLSGTILCRLGAAFLAA
jgi:hypothetical protein